MLLSGLMGFFHIQALNRPDSNTVSVSHIGGVYDDRFLVKDTEASRAVLSVSETPYEGAAPMLLVDTEDRAVIAALVAAMLPELPEPRKRRK